MPVKADRAKISPEIFIFERKFAGTVSF